MILNVSLHILSPPNNFTPYPLDMIPLPASSDLLDPQFLLLFALFPFFIDFKAGAHREIFPAKVGAMVHLQDGVVIL